MLPEEGLFIFLAALLLTLTVSIILLWLYRKALQASMSLKAGARSSLPVSERPGRQLAAGVQIRVITVAEALARGRDSTLHAVATARRRRAALMYGLAAAAQAIAGACLHLLLSKRSLMPLRVAVLSWVYAWPAVLTWNLLSGPDWKGRLQRVTLYFTGLAGLSILGFIKMDVPHRLGQGTLLWTTLMLTPTVLLYPCLARPIRAVGPVVLVFMTIAMLGVEVSLSAYENVFAAGNELSFRNPRYWLVSLAGFSVLGLCAAPVLGYFRRRHEIKGTSDMILTLDCLWLLFSLFACLIQTDARGVLRLAPLVTFVTYKAVVSLCQKRLWREAAASPGRRLLLLRVFGHRRRTRQMLDLLGARWRYLGSIQCIAGTDLAADYLGIPQFFDYMSRRLKRYFIHSTDDLEGRVQSLDVHPDPDGRFRVNMFFCLDNTWKMTVTRLIGVSDAILMDLRGFTQANRGCAEELHAIFNAVPALPLVLVIDSSTNLIQLEHALKAALPAEREFRIDILKAGGAARTASAAIRLLDPANLALASSSAT